MLKLWVLFKTWAAKKRGRIHALNVELKFIKTKTAQDLVNLKNNYRTDLLFGHIPWDLAYDSIRIFKRRFVDCGLNRAWQAFYHTKDYESYLVHFTHKPMTKEELKIFVIDNLKQKNIRLFHYLLNCLGILGAHITCVVKKGGLYYACDYGHMRTYMTFNGAIMSIANRYNLATSEIVIQDIDWRITNGI